MTRAQRAQLAWLVLVGAAHNRQVLTYTIVAERIGMGAGTLAQVLGCIMYYCQQNDLPPLTVLVVKQDTGLPGDGLRTLEDLARDREAVFNTEWFKRIPPTEVELETALQLGRAATMASQLLQPSRTSSKVFIAVSPRSNEELKLGGPAVWFRLRQ
jgi:hypothetical protein